MKQRQPQRSERRGRNRQQPAGRQTNRSARRPRASAARAASSQTRLQALGRRRSMVGATLPPLEYAPADVMPASRQRRPSWFSRHKALTTVLVVLLLGASVFSWYGSQWLSAINKVFHGNFLSDIEALFSTTRLKGESQGRVNILLAGDSVGDPGHQGATLADSIMVVSIDTKNHTGFMLSIPRDLWVDIPGWSHQKINAANTVTDFSQAGYPNGGMGQLEEIVQTDLGIPIDYYALINYSAFKDAVNAVGGITINIQSPDPRGVYDAYTHLDLPNGKVTLNGTTALALARARGDGSAGDVSYGLPQGDFSRTEHQRQMLVALAQKAQSVGVLSNPGKITKLFDAFGNNVQTDMTLPEVSRFVRITKGMNIGALQSKSYSYGGTHPLLTSYTDPYSGQDALIPSAGIDDFSQLQAYYQQLVSAESGSSSGN